ncbi:2-keto-3-deoxy-galactonokinase [Salipiger sp. CCB-MM3]|uniref:2-dehydro-3-deoxygalactonokinase n=1 Tax=Salipiger sp. CCB-MM3 TaxID=1792508 RepID=UPI00080AA312|nr:2-dehydro-3-deoxygalactonokinase [Salipiger sp. CCB-MM3]ANT59626.1 2-keto-3-deoxy-galactonokinase [Salipiger sp. CCB-MM3]
MTDAAATDWIAVDWGTSNLRLWRMAADGTVLERVEGDAGMGRLSPEDFEPTLLSLLPDLKARTTVLVCGMAGARQGWIEAPYLSVPCAPPKAAEGIAVPTEDSRLDVRILPGVSQNSPADVMRGEETQVAGFLALNPRFDGVICLPGTHSKWVHVSAGEIISFRSFMTGEIFELLSQRSVLRHGLGQGWDDAAFAAAVDQAMGRPAGFAAELFTLRAEGLLHGLSPDAAAARLSGLLIGMELSAAKPYWLGTSVALLGASKLVAHYRKALEAQAVPVLIADADRMTLEGLKAARKEETQA